MIGACSLRCLRYFLGSFDMPRLTKSSSFQDELLFWHRILEIIVTSRDLGSRLLVSQRYCRSPTYSLNLTCSLNSRYYSIPEDYSSSSRLRLDFTVSSTKLRPSRSTSFTLFLHRPGRSMQVFYLLPFW